MSRSSKPSRNSPAAGWAKHVLAHRRIEAGQRPQPSIPVRVGEEPHVHHDVGVERQAVLVAERLDGELQLPGGRLVAAERGDEPRLQLVDVEVGRVDDQVGDRLAPDRASPARARSPRARRDRPRSHTGGCAASTRSAARARAWPRRGTARAHGCRRPAATSPCRRARRAGGRRRARADRTDRRARSPARRSCRPARWAGCRRRTSRDPRARPPPRTALRRTSR